MRVRPFTAVTLWSVLLMIRRKILPPSSGHKWVEKKNIFYTGRRFIAAQQFKRPLFEMYFINKYLWCSCELLGLFHLAKSACYLHTCTSVRPTEHISAVPTGHVTVKCNNGSCMKICRENPVQSKSEKKSGNLFEGINKFCCCRWQ